MVPIVFAACVAVALIAASVRVVPESARLATWRLGRFLGLRGPGVLLVLPAVDRAVRIQEGDEAQMASETTATAKGVEIPVTAAGAVRRGQPVIVRGFGPDGAVVLPKQI